MHALIQQHIVFHPLNSPSRTCQAAAGLTTPRRMEVAFSQRSIMQLTVLAALAVVVLVLGLTTRMPTAAAAEGSTRKLPTPLYPDLNVGPQLEEARRCMQRWGLQADEAANHLPAVYLHVKTGSYHDDLLACSIDHLLSNVAATTPTDIFVFTREEARTSISRALNRRLSAASEKRVCMITIPDDQWRRRPAREAPYKLPITRRRSYLFYYIMGQWRLLVPYNIMYALGYDYFLQVDDDLFITKPFELNVISHMRKNNLQIATHKTYRDQPHVLHGLPELARFFLQVNEITPKRSVYDHVYPADMVGIFSDNIETTSNLRKHAGWDRTILHGNFMIMSTHLWADDRVQDWINLCLGSSGMERFRWQEQGVMTWIWLMFTDPQELWRISPEDGLSYVHSRNNNVTQAICGNPSSLQTAVAHKHQRQKHKQQ